MFLPSKHIGLSESLLGLGGLILSFLNEPLTLDELWIRYKSINKKKFPANHNFENFIYAIDFLFLIGAIDIIENGKIINVFNKS